MPRNDPSATRRRNLALAIALALAALAGSGVYAWEAQIKPRYIVKNFGVVEAGQVYRSGRLTTHTLDKVIRERGIKTVIDFGADAKGSPEDLAEQAVCDAKGLPRHRLDLNGDGTGDPNMYVAALRILADPANHPVLLHCGAGAQRTSAAVILYRHLMQNKTITEVYPEAFAFGHKPRKDFILPTYLADWITDIERSYRTGEPIPVRMVNGQARRAEPAPETQVVNAAP